MCVCGEGVGVCGCVYMGVGMHVCVLLCMLYKYHLIWSTIIVLGLAELLDC